MPERQGDRRFLRLAEAPTPKGREIVVSVSHDRVALLALEISMLLYNESKTLRLGSGRGPSVVLTVGEGTHVSKALAHYSASEVWRFELGRNQAEYLLATLLRAHRDGAAEVNHIHIEAELDGALFDLTVFFDVSKEPMSQEEAMRILSSYD